MKIDNRTSDVRSIPPKGMPCYVVINRHLSLHRDEYVLSHDSPIKRPCVFKGENTDISSRDYGIKEATVIEAQIYNNQLTNERTAAYTKFEELRAKGIKAFHTEELRAIDRFYPSSKMCHICGNVKSDLKLSDRTYKCDCGNVIDRDYQASINIRDCRSYNVA